MQILVTGAAGFIGSNLSQHLLDRGHRVIGYDNLSQGLELNLAALREHPGFRFEQADIRDRAALLSASQGCDVLVHLAAFKIPRYSDAYDTLLINGFGSQVVAEVAAEVKAKVVAASTSDIYGKNPTLPFTEESDSVIGGPKVRRWAYAISKMFEEQLLFAAHERFGLEVVLLRFFGGYGPHQNLSWWGGPQAVFINHALDNEAIPIHGDGQQTRTFTYISDHVQGITLAVEKAEANNQVFNLGSFDEITIVDLARLIWRLVRGREETPRLEFIPYENFGKYEDVRRRVPDLRLAKDLLGFVPQVGLEAGLRKTILWQVERRRALGIPTPDPVLGD
jgi:UDP-glucose 4-epimerase